MNLRLLFFLVILVFDASARENTKITYKGNELDGLAFIRGGTFQMGSNKGEKDEQPVHSVMVDDFYIGKYEVTHKEYLEFLNASNVDSSGSCNGQEYIDMDDGDCAIKYRKGKFSTGWVKKIKNVIFV